MSALHTATEAGHGTGAPDPVRAAYATERDHYSRARDAGDREAAWQHLERAHIIAQPRLGLHWSSHIDMLGFALSCRDVREIFGQLLRIMLVPLGALTGRLPVGNTGRARVSAFAPMPVPEDLRPYLPGDTL
ncbi:MAG: hypothetical protein CVT78_07065 [Alphaproteobacteria bacterium HGW-Alphaproteobacteria-17]|nr:MAG: hypothetical protein CVT78_07065 [Alphaproteobacteria bacterium HGW-Alphaproteobacteria-17]